MLKKIANLVILAMVLAILPQKLFAEVDSCTECNVLMNGKCLAEKYLPFNQTFNKEREWSASDGNFFAKENVIGVRFRLDNQSMDTLELGGFGLEIEVVEKNGHKLKWESLVHNFPGNARVINDTKALDRGNDIVNAVLIRNPENLKAGKDYYAWFYFKSIPESGILIQPNLVIDIDSDCSLAEPFCFDVSDSEVCEYFPMETDSYERFTAYPNGSEGVEWKNRKTSERNSPILQKLNGQWYISKETNPSDSEDGESGDDYKNLPSSTTSDSGGSSKKPNLYSKEWKFKNGKTKYYDDENIILEAKVKNSGKSVDKDITKIKLKYYRFKGEKENGDRKEIGDDNMKGENLESGETKEEDIKIGAPDGDNKWQFYYDIDTGNAVSESNENDNRSGTIACRVHKRPDIKAEKLLLNDERTQFDLGEVPEARVTFKNDGGESFKDIPVKWYLDGVLYAEDNMRHWNIEHGEEKHESVNLTQLSIGTHTLKVCADNSDDKHKNDNCKEITFEVIPAEEEISSEIIPENLTETEEASENSAVLENAEDGSENSETSKLDEEEVSEKKEDDSEAKKAELPKSSKPSKSSNPSANDDSGCFAGAVF